jgi:hypothetical protein
MTASRSLIVGIRTTRRFGSVYTMARVGIPDTTVWLKIGVIASFVVLAIAAIAGQVVLVLSAAFALVVGMRMQHREEARRLHGVRRKRRRRS